MYILINKLDEIVNKCNSTYHSTIEMKPANVKNNAYIGFGKKSNNKDSKFKVDQARISKYKNIFAKGYPHMLLMILMVKKLLERFMKKNCKKQAKKNLG